MRPPIGKRKRYPALDLSVIHAQERCKPEGRAAIDWKLITDLPVHSPEEAIEKLGWYARRWQIELFHKILTSGCRAEEARLRTAERLVNLLALFCILSWRLFWLTMANRAAIETMPRTINTGLGTMFILAALAILGGDSLRDFAIALLVGLVVGTYSSVFTATPLLTYLQERAPMSRVKKEKVVREPDDSGAVI